MRFLIACFAILFTSAASAAETPEQFFERFVNLGHRFDPAVIDLYRDTASIQMYRRYPHGLERATEMSGVEWKSLIRKMMPLVKEKDDRSIYTNVKVSSAGAKVKITADRYVVRKCYTDNGYYLVIEQQPNGQYGVVEEHFVTEPRPDCR